jgi:hypothetical protein
MVNNSVYPYINGMNSHLSPQTIEHKKRQQHMALEIQVLAWDMHKCNCGRDKPANVIPLMIIGSPMAIQIQTIKTPAKTCLHSKRTHTIN